MQGELIMRASPWQKSGGRVKTVYGLGERGVPERQDGWHETTPRTVRPLGPGSRG